MSISRQSILFVSGLDKSVNETQLYLLFKEYQISYIKIAKDHTSRRSFGYAFVGFKSHCKAEDAMIKLNFSRIANKSIRITWYNRDENNLRNRVEYNIFVKRISKTVTPKEFYDYFSKFGNIVSSKLVEDESGESLGYGFIQFDNENSAIIAINQTHLVNFKGKSLYVAKFIKNKPKKNPQFNTVYVRNIPKEFTTENLKNLFSKYGEILDIFVKSPEEKALANLPDEKKSHIMNFLFAFITFKDFNSAEKAVNEASFLKPSNPKFNKELLNLSEIVKDLGRLEEKEIYKFSSFLIDNVENYKEALLHSNILEEIIENFRKIDGSFQRKERMKNEFLDCCRAMKKKDREKNLLQLYENIKKQIKEKYKFCNLYVKNIPNDISEQQITKLFEFYGKIRSIKLIHKDFPQAHFGFNNSIRKLFGFVCYFEKEHAREAKLSLSNKPVFDENYKLYIDYHQSKEERNEYLKLKSLSTNHYNTLQRKKETQIISRNFMNKPHNFQLIERVQEFQPITYDKQSYLNLLGERLFSKLSSMPVFFNFSILFSKIVGMFLDLNEKVIHRLINDDNYFIFQVKDAVQVK